MSLRSKLDRRRLGSHDPAAGPDVPLATPPGDKSNLLDSLRDRMAEVARRHAPASEASRPPASDDEEASSTAVPGQQVETPMGPVWVRRMTVTKDHCHGHASVGGFHERCDALAALARDERLDGFDSRRALLLDLETTGLDRGAGTLPFLVGTGWFEDDGTLQVELLFCRDPSEEPAALHLLAERMGNAGAVVTFNGRSFDVPLVNTRFVLNRMKNPGWSLPHLDLLLAARRVFKRRLRDCSLGHLERAVLGFERHGDIPSAEIPAAYINYLRGRDRGAMALVLEHNALDIIALAALGGELGKFYLDPETVEHAVDHLGLASLALRVGDADSAGAHLGRAMGVGEELSGCEAALWSARAAAKRKDLDQAQELYQRALALDAHCGAAHLALSKLYEHYRKDYPAALLHARAAAEVEGDEGSEHRVARLKRKLDARGETLILDSKGGAS